MSKLSWGMKSCSVILLWATMAVVLPAQTFTTLYNFCSQTNCTDGSNPTAALIQATDGNLYGTTFFGGGNGGGTVFKITPMGTLTRLHTFNNGRDGVFPYAGLVQGTNGDFFGTTETGGEANGLGTVFRIAASGRPLKTIYSFCVSGGADCGDGYDPIAGLVQGTNGDFYGTTVGGGAQGPNSYGTVFRIGPRGGQRTLHSFDIIENGQSPAAALVQATDGNFYGTTSGGGAHFYGTVFKITPGGSLTKLHSFGGPDGENPNSALIQAADGNLYGTTTSGGAGERYGTIFKISTSGIVMTLHSLDGSDGWAPNAALIQATDGNFYGTTSKGGRNDLNPCPDGCGTIFKITPSGTLTTLYNFCSQIQNDVCTDGAIPSAALIQDTNGTLYGTTGEGGANTNSSCTNGCGTVFSLSLAR
jgi:uncharacterized repeat protein (TIGR03803 family)